MSQYVDEEYRLIHSGKYLLKEDVRQLVCVHGVGCGKSTLVSNGLTLLKKHCRNEELKEILSDEKHSLAIHITFNIDMPFSHAHETSMDLAVIRRVLASCLGLDWNTAINLPLGNLRISDCIGAIVSYHKAVNGVSDEQGMFVYLGIDEVNKLVNGQLDDIATLKNLIQVVQRLSSHQCFVSTLLAGTHVIALSHSFLSSGIYPLWVNLARLSEEAQESMLVTDAGVSQKYIDNPKFQKLLRDIGPVSMRAIGIAVSQLEYVYSEESIASARTAARDYLRLTTSGLSYPEIQSLLGLVLTGRTVHPFETLGKDSAIFLDELQNCGTVHLIPTPDILELSVSISRIMLEDYLKAVTFDSYLVVAAKILLCCLDHPRPDSLAKFVAYLHRLKKTVFYETHRSTSARTVALTTLFPEALMHPELEKQTLLLSRASSVGLKCADKILSSAGLQDSDGVEPNISNIDGKQLNAKGAAMNILTCEKVRNFGDYDWKKVVIAYSVKQTNIDDMKQLSSDEITDDIDKAVAALSKSKSHSKSQMIMVHFTNRELSREVTDVSKWPPSWQRSIIVGHNNLEGVVGPLFARMLTSKAFHGNGKGNGPASKSFSTLARTAAAITGVLKIFR